MNTVQAEAERLQKGWGAGVFSQAYQMLRKDREDEVRAEAAASLARQAGDALAKLPEPYRAFYGERCTRTLRQRASCSG